MNAPPWPLNPAVGEFFQNWVWNGSRWVAAPARGARVMTRVFKASGPYMPSPGLISAVVECIGAGGGGGGAGPPQNATFILRGGGGSSGGYSRSTLAAPLVRGGVNVTIGAGGNSSTQTGGTHGPDGESTTFGALCVANGGHGGQACDGIATGGLSGEGAPIGVGDVAFPGAHGFLGGFQVLAAPISLDTTGGPGGEMFGGGSSLSASGGARARGGDGATNTGAGGAGACINQAPASMGFVPGGNGGSGVCIVTEYCWADAAQDDSWWKDQKTVNVNVRNVRGDPCWPSGPGPRPPGPWVPGGQVPPGPPRPRELEYEDDPTVGQWSGYADDRDP